MSKTNYSEVWDLESIFPGGSQSPEFHHHLEQLSSMTDNFSKELQAFETPSKSDDVNTVADFIDQGKDILMNLEQAGAFVSCLEAQDIHDKQANVLRSRMTDLSAQFSTAFNILQQKLALTDDAVWVDLLQHPKLSELTFVLNEWRKNAKDKLSETEEALIESLSVDGYHGWGQMYDTIVGSMTIPVTLDGKKQEVSVGQADNLSAHGDPEVRKEVFDRLEEAWSEKEELFAKTLNHMAGFRLNVYERRGWDDVLKEPLEYNRMKKSTLNAMWNAIAKHKKPFADYLNRKAELLGKDKLDWQDLNAPLSSADQTLSFQEGAKFIIKHFRTFGPNMAQFAEKALDDSWIEAEDRPGKRPGGFCTSFPLSDQSRIFMTYNGSMSNVATLAHELGHAFHTYTLQNTHPLNRDYAMNVAETASTFAESIVSDAAVQEAETDEQKKSLLEAKLQRSVAMFMNIHARFLFETRFYEERKQGIVPAQRLNELMEEAQREAYADTLGEAHPHFWASKLHFYITDVPFYNFPYTFGYLFSLSIYAKAREEGASYEEKYMALLRDTAIMPVEDLVMKHLGEDITKEAFWEKGIKLCMEDVEAFLKLTH
ncbi:M3 family oligoendopeptidase [Salinibacillus aidingensis]|uniref:M3 family oligoendopeptidase n=1 Tax=Salinibacillus aidingensis TaxID=237684 RepID=A0ABN1BNZ3_9BACI